MCNSRKKKNKFKINFRRWLQECEGWASLPGCRAIRFGERNVENNTDKSNGIITIILILSKSTNRQEVIVFVV